MHRSGHRMVWGESALSSYFITQFFGEDQVSHHNQDRIHVDSHIGDNAQFYIKVPPSNLSEICV